MKIAGLIRLKEDALGGIAVSQMRKLSTRSAIVAETVPEWDLTRTLKDVGCGTLRE